MSVNELQKFWTLLSHHHLLGPILTILIYLILAKVVDILFQRVFRRLTKVTHITLDDYIVQFLHWPIIINIILLGPLHVIYTIKLSPFVVSLSSNIIKSLIILIWWITAFRLIRLVAKRKAYLIERFGDLGGDVVVLLKNLAYILVTVTGVICLLSTWHIDLTPFLASAGIAGVAVALAARETLSNFFGGISIFLDRTYKVSDYIILDSGERGEVIDVGIRSTRIRTRDDVIITIPNSIMANSKIINESAPEPRFRLRLPVGVAYGSDLKRVEEVLLEEVYQVPHVVTDPQARVRYRRFGDSSVDLELLCWVDDPRFKGVVTHALIKRIHQRFEKEGITIPFPQRDVHLYQKD